MSSMGSGGLHIREIARLIKGTFDSVEKNSNGRLDSWATRYLANTFFLNEYGWRIRGLEPQRALNDTNVRPSHIPGNRNDAPSFLLTILNNRYKDGLGLGSALAFLALIGNLI